MRFKILTAQGFSEKFREYWPEKSGTKEYAFDIIKLYGR